MTYTSINIMDAKYCPLTHQIMYSPVVAEDGYSYEEDIIVDFLKKDSRSPITREKISNKVYKSLTIKNLIRKYLADHPEELHKMYKPEHPHWKYIGKINECMKKEMYNDILKYTEFVLDYITPQYLYKFVHNCKDNKIHEWFINNQIKAESVDLIGNNLVSIYCDSFSDSSENNDIIKHIIDISKNNLTKQNQNGSCSIHFASVNQSAEIINYLISKHSDSSCVDIKNIWGNNAIHYILMNNNITYEHLDIVIKFVKEKPRRWVIKNRSYQNSIKRSPLGVALMKLNFDNLMYLHKNGLKFNYQTTNDYLDNNVKLSKEEKDNFIDIIFDI